MMAFVQSFPPGPSLDIIYSIEIINSLSLTKRTYTVCMMRHVKVQVLARIVAGKGAKSRFLWSLSVSQSHYNLEYLHVQNLWNVTKVVLRGIFTALNVNIRKEKG